MLGSGTTTEMASRSAGGLLILRLEKVGGLTDLRVRSAWAQWVGGQLGAVVSVTGCCGQKRAENSTSNHTTTDRQTTDSDADSCTASRQS